ncbi:hypothetical protein [Demequina capsici]|uniref:Uncharacterized protein n=1 Tax=Demequina capsici TaxID=3075620 RepID=A0AA96F598_9MICO|nr:hypothetical protein [Demequina sp. OYTSA14]WNM24291.1 hypothetical protein RN606_13150 [Demequina sp. OYTSA14]
MRLRIALREAWRNIAGGTGRTLTLTLTLLAIAVSCQAADVLSARAIVHEAQVYQDAGANVLVLSSAGNVDPVRFKALASQPNVIAAGALRTTTDQVAAALPGSSIPAYETTPGFASILTGRPSTGVGVTIASDVATTVGVGVGDTLPLLAGTARVDGVYGYPQDGRVGGLGYSILIPTTDTSAFDACWVQEWPMTDTTAMLLRGTVMPASGNDAAPAQLSQFNATLGTTLDSAAAYASRPTRWAPVGALLLGALTAFGLLRLRQLEHASALHLGVRRLDLLAIILVETVMAALLATIACLASGALLARFATVEDVDTTLRLALLSPASASAGAMLGAMAGGASVREASLMRLFKER